jgi:hypothetical protein
MAERQKQEKQELDIPQIVTFLNHAFAKATQGMGRAARTVHKDLTVTKTALYQLQVDFCYLIDDIQRSPLYIVPKLVAEANETIEKLSRNVKVQET